MYCEPGCLRVEKRPIILVLGLVPPEPYGFGDTRHKDRMVFENLFSLPFQPQNYFSVLTLPRGRKCNLKITPFEPILDVGLELELTSTDFCKVIYNNIFYSTQIGSI